MGGERKERERERKAREEEKREKEEGILSICTEDSLSLLLSWLPQRIFLSSDDHAFGPPFL